MKNFLVLLMTCIIMVMFSCNQNANDQEKSATSKSNASISVVYHKKNGITEMYLCLAKDTNWAEIKNECSNLVKNSELGFVYCYDDTSKIRKLNDLPEEKVDYFCELIKRPGDPIEFNKVTENYKRIVENGDINKVKFILIDKKERMSGGQKKSTYRWYVFYVENFYDNKEVYNRMKEEAAKLPVDNPNDKTPNKNKQGITNVYFFRDKIHAPKLENDGGWGAKESSNSMDKKYGKYLICYISFGGGYDQYFSKGF